MSKRKSEFVVYEGQGEVLITTPNFEKKFIEKWFDRNSGRSLDNYDRCEGREVIEVIPDLRITLQVMY